jgi:hypothetical protein
MNEVVSYPVPGRSADRNARIASHEIGHALVGRAIGTHIHCTTIIPDHGPNGYQGRTVRSGPVSELTLTDSAVLETEEILSICERLERLTPELGSNRVESSEYYLRAQSNIIELVAGQEAELLLYPGPALGAQHDFSEADAFAKICVVASPAIASLIEYCKAEARAILRENLDIARALVAELVNRGTLVTEQIDEIIVRGIAIKALAAEHEARRRWQHVIESASRFSSIAAVRAAR